MKREKRYWKSSMACFVLVMVLFSCSYIDDDLSHCGDNYQMDYELRLVTNMSTELSTTLTTQTDLSVAAAVRNHLKGIFTDHAHDVDLSFYDTDGDSARLQHDEHIMDANQSSYQLFLPKRRYMHIASANIVNNPVVHITGGDHCHTASLVQLTGDTIASHTTGIFTARQQMEVLEGIDQQFNVHLYMANCAATLIIDPRGHDLSGLRVYTTGFASEFRMNDSVYVFSEKAPIVRTDEVDTDSTGLRAFTSVTFPSREPDKVDTRSVIETIEPFISRSVKDALWQFRVYHTAADGSTTETLLGVHQPLRAGQLKIIKAYLNDEGRLETEDHTIGVSVTLKWDRGNEFYPEL